MPERGDLLMIDWHDITESSIEDPNFGHPAQRTTFGLFWEQNQRKGVDTLVTTTTEDADDPSQSGYCAYPAGCIKEVWVLFTAKQLKRLRKRPGVWKKEVKNANPPDQPTPQ